MGPHAHAFCTWSVTHETCYTLRLTGTVAGTARTGCMLRHIAVQVLVISAICHNLKIMEMQEKVRGK